MLEEFSVKAIKRILFIFNLFFALTGLILILVGVAIKSYFTEYELFIDDRYFSASSLLIASGSIIFIVSFFGCCGAIRENRCMVLTFSILLTFVMILEFASGVTGYVLANKTGELINTKVHDTLKLYPNVTDIEILWDAVQKEFQCCGIDGPKDWIDAVGKLPLSCCDGLGALHNLTCTVESSRLYKNSCRIKLTEVVKDSTTVLGCVAFSIIAAQFIGIVFACYLGRYIRKSNYETV
ncbi:23 kDa integral membrane protein [Halyomorpha halys]|uniref:23 kDa integral membrane protein n=1 Tax=Halyomorpha halys TaxID=286706 RepID=UPI0006D4D20D